MEPRNGELKKMPEKCQRNQPRQFHIMKLEQRIAPNKGGIANGGSGSCDGGLYCHHGKGGYGG